MHKHTIAQWYAIQSVAKFCELPISCHSSIKIWNLNLEVELYKSTFAVAILYGVQLSSAEQNGESVTNTSFAMTPDVSRHRGAAIARAYVWRGGVHDRSGRCTADCFSCYWMPLCGCRTSMNNVPISALIHKTLDWAQCQWGEFCINMDGSLIKMIVSR